MDAVKIDGLLRCQFIPPEWAVFSELADGTGGNYGRTIDLFALNLYPSKRFRSVAFEIKVTRGDFMREIEHPLKRASCERYAGECYFAVPIGMVKKDEVPEGWGLYEIGDTVRRTKAATQRDVGTWPMSFVAALARRCSEPRVERPAALWKCLGKEMGEDELLSLASANLKKHDETMKKVGVTEYKNSPEMERLLSLESAVKSACGKGYWQSVTADDFKVWRESLDNPGYTPQSKRQVAVELDRLKEAMKKAGMLE